MPPTNYKYNAFISYSRRDEAIAKNIEKFLEHYSIPKAFQTETQKKFNIFRDIQDIQLGELSEELKAGLDHSEYLILLCSPHSYRSTYVDEEIKYFGNLRGRENILSILISGRPNHEVKPNDPNQDAAFNEALFDFFEEPLAAEFRKFPEEGYWKRQTRIREARFQIISKLLHTDKTDELVGRYKWNQRLKIGAVSVLFLLASLFFGWRYYDAIPKSGIYTSQIETATEEGKRTVQNLEILEAGLQKEVPEKTDKSKLLLATWNIKDLALKTRMGNRTDESFAYIAQVLSHFDIIAVQEVKESLEPLQRLLSFLGKHWEIKFSGVAEGRAGNRERLGFIYDTRKIQLGDMTDEIVLAEGIPDKDGNFVQIARTPYLAEFFYQGTPIQICNVHILYGRPNREGYSMRLKELGAISKILNRRNNRAEGKLHMMLLGDMNVPRENDSMMLVMEDNGFYLPPTLKNAPSNLMGTKPYDQIAIGKYKGEIPFDVLSEGVFDFYQFVYKDEDWKTYEAQMIAAKKNRPFQSDEEKKKYFRRQWKSYQMSDHRVKWVELKLK